MIEISKRLSITVSDYVYETYLQEYNGNRSEYIEQLIQIGSETMLNQDKSLKVQLIQLLKDKSILEQDNRNLKLQFENLKIKHNKRLQKEFKFYNVNTEEELEIAKDKHQKQLQMLRSYQALGVPQGGGR